MIPFISRNRRFGADGIPGIADVGCPERLQDISVQAAFPRGAHFDHYTGVQPIRRRTPGCAGSEDEEVRKCKARAAEHLRLICVFAGFILSLILYSRGEIRNMGKG